MAKRAEKPKKKKKKKMKNFDSDPGHPAKIWSLDIRQNLIYIIIVSSNWLMARKAEKSKKIYINTQYEKKKNIFFV